MPQLVTYKGQPVKKHERTSDGRVRLIMVSPNEHEAGEQLVVTQDEWLRYSNKQYFESGEMPDKREMVRRGK